MSGRQGHVLATDISAEMVAEAAAGAARAGLGNVATRVLDVAAIDLEPDRWDAVISRLGLMFTPDLAAALAGARRVLRPGGRLAAIVWSTPERNPFHATPLAVLRALGRPAPPDAELVRALSLGAPGVLAQALAAAGFRDVVVEPVSAPRRHASVAEAIAAQRDSRPLARAMAHLDDADARRRLGGDRARVSRVRDALGRGVPGRGARRRGDEVGATASRAVPPTEDRPATWCVSAAGARAESWAR